MNPIHDKDRGQENTDLITNVEKILQGKKSTANLLLVLSLRPVGWLGLGTILGIQNFFNQNGSHGRKIMTLLELVINSKVD